MKPHSFERFSDEERFSRWMSYVLRHNPTRYGLQPDEHGYVDLPRFIQVAARRDPEITEAKLREMVAGNLYQRFEIAGGKLRARYGHSIAVQPAGEAVEPPDVLFHAVEAHDVPRACAEGLRPLERQLLHLSETADDALAVARRRLQQPAPVRVLAREAAKEGIAFYRESRVYLTRYVPSEFVQPVLDSELHASHH